MRDAFVTIDELNYEYNEPAQAQSVDENVAPTSTIKEEASTLNKVSETEIATVAVVAPNAESPKNLNLTRNDYQSDSILSLKSMDYGFDVLDLNDELYMTLLKTAAEDVYMVKGMEAIVFKMDGEWILSTNDGNVATSKVLNIRD